MLTLVQIYWRRKINQLLRATRGFLTSSLFSLSSLIALRGSSLSQTSGSQGTDMYILLTNEKIMHFNEVTVLFIKLNLIYNKI